MSSDGKYELVCQIAFWEEEVKKGQAKIADLQKGLDQTDYKEGDWVSLGGLPTQSRLYDALPSNLIIQLGRKYDDGFGWWSPYFQMGFRIYHKYIMGHIPKPEPKPKRIPWSAEDYAERQIVYLWNGDKIVALSHLWEETAHINDNPWSYLWISNHYTLPDGTELYKDGE